MQKATEGKWEWLFGLPQLILWKPPVRYSGGHIKHRLEMLESGNVDALYAMWLNEHKRISRVISTPIVTRGKEDKEAERVRKAAFSALAEGYPGVALRRLSPKPFVRPDEAHNLLEPLHPSEPVPTTLAEPGIEVEITSVTSASAIKRIPIISAPGPSGLRVSHMRPLITDSTGSKHLSKVLTLIVNGEGPQWLRNARLVAIAKPNGGARPIAIGEILRRLAATALNEQFLSNDDSIPRNQLALIRDGAIVGAHIVSCGVNNGLSVACLDTSNAFNSIRRETLLRKVRGTTLQRYVTWAYGTHSRLIIDRDHIIVSQRGVQQGDPLGMTLFCLGIAEALENVRTTNSNVDIISYADDIFLLGNPADIENCVNQLVPELEGCGLKLNNKKSSIWPPLTATQQALLPTIKDFQKSPSTLTILGIPVAGDRESCLREIVHEAAKNIEPLKKLQHKQGEMTILRSAGPFTRIAHLLRSIKPNDWPEDLLERADELTLRELERIACAPISQSVALIALLPISCGGVGLQSATDKTRHAQLFAEAQHSIAVQLTKMHRLESSNITSISNTGPSNNGNAIIQEVLTNGSPIERLLLQQTADAHSGAFLTAKPCGSTELSDEAFSIALRLRLGLDVLPAGFRCETHNVELDTLGRHALSCQNFQGDVARMHNLIRDAIFAQCSLIDRKARVIESAFQPDQNSEEHNQTTVKTEQRATENTVPGDVVVRLSSTDSTETYYDIVVVNCLTDHSLNESAKFPSPVLGFEHLLNIPFNHKLKKHAHDVQRFGARFVPLVFSTVGNMHGDSLSELRRLSNYVAGRLGQYEPDKWRDLLAELACALARGNAMILDAVRHSVAACSNDPPEREHVGGALGARASRDLLE